MSHLIAAALFVAGLVHLLPIAGMLGAAKLATLYGVQIDDPNLEILMRHRAVLFALLSATLILAAFKPEFQIAAIAAGFISTVSFLWLAWQVGGYNAQLARVLTADIVAIVCLIVAAGFRIFASPS